jgi:hypothetical protein
MAVSIPLGLLVLVDGTNNVLKVFQLSQDSRSLTFLHDERVHGCSLNRETAITFFGDSSPLLFVTDPFPGNAVFVVNVAERTVLGSVFAPGGPWGYVGCGIAACPSLVAVSFQDEDEDEVEDDSLSMILLFKVDPANPLEWTLERRLGCDVLCRPRGMKFFKHPDNEEEELLAVANSDRHEVVVFSVSTGAVVHRQQFLFWIMDVEHLGDFRFLCCGQEDFASTGDVFSKHSDDLPAALVKVPGLGIIVLDWSTVWVLSATVSL